MSGPVPALRLAEDAEGRLADAQDGNCPACSQPLKLAGAVLTLASPPDEGPAVPVLMHEDCLRDGRRWPDFEVLADKLAGDRAQAAEKALAGAVDHARRAVEAAAAPVIEEAARAVEEAQNEARSADSTATKARTEAAAARAETKATKEEVTRTAAELEKARQDAENRRTLAVRLALAIVEFLVKADPYDEQVYLSAEPTMFKKLADAVPEGWRETLEDQIRKAAGQPRS